jgi:metallophosphoesterase superfamily enzyme
MAPGVVALPGGLAWLPGCRALLAADAHFGYEDVVGAALPVWSTDEIAAYLHVAIARLQATELIFLGDAIHGTRMHEGAERRVRAALALLRDRVSVTVVAGNHEGATRGIAALGDVVEEAERDGWLLLHGDRGRSDARPAIIGHLHPSLHLGGERSVQAFVGSDRIVVVPALTPHSTGLDVLSEACSKVLRRWTNAPQALHVVAVTAEAVYPFGALASLRPALRSRSPGPRRPGRLRRLESG